MKMKNGLPLQGGLAMALLSLSANAFSHVRWFVEDKEQYSAVRFDVDTLSLVLVLCAVLYGVFCIFLNAQNDKNSILSVSLFKRFSLKGVEWSLLKASVALMFIANMFGPSFVAPNLDGALVGKDLFFILQGMILISLAFSEVVLGVAVLALTSSIVVFYGMDLAVDYAFEFVGLAIFFCLLGMRKAALTRRYLPWSEMDYVDMAVHALRIGVGLQLVVLAIHNKFMNPALGLAFLGDYPSFNFMHFLGIKQFDDIHFVLSAGLAELSFGLLLVLNIATRFVALSVMFFFSLTSFLLGYHELVGHLVILAALLIIALHPSRAKQSFAKLAAGIPVFHRVERV